MSIHNFGLVFFQPHNLPLLGRRRKRMTLIKKYAQRQEKKSHEISKPTKLFLHEFPVIDMKNVLKPFESFNKYVAIKRKNNNNSKKYTKSFNKYKVIE